MEDNVNQWFFSVCSLLWWEKEANNAMIHLGATVLFSNSILNSSYWFVEVIWNMTTTIDDDESPFFSSSAQPMDMFTGDLSGTGHQSNKSEISTLNEPVLDTIKRL